MSSRLSGLPRRGRVDFLSATTRLLWLAALAGAALTFAFLQLPAARQAPVPSIEYVAAGPAVDSVLAPIPLPNAGPDPALSPRRLVIPRLRMAAQVEPVGRDDNGNMGTPADVQNVGWYQPGSQPGEGGDSVIDGHSIWYSGPAVFHALDQLQTGDLIGIVRVDGSRLDFVIDRIASFPYTAAVPGLFSSAGPPQLTLITCTGGWDPAKHVYLQRLVVHSSLVMTSKEPALAA